MLYSILKLTWEGEYENDAVDDGDDDDDFVGKTEENVGENHDEMEKVICRQCVCGALSNNV